MRRPLLTVLAFTLAVPPVAAGVYTPDDPCPFNICPDGTAEPLPHDLFVARLVDRLAPRVENAPVLPGIPDWAHDTSGDDPVMRATYAALLGQRLAARWPKAQTLRGDDLAAHTAALLRFARTQQALNLLDRGRVGRSYTLRANRAHAFATLGEWADAVSNLPDDPTDDPPPAGTTPEQFRWQRAIDETAYRRWLTLREADARTKPPLTDATPDLIFETADGRPIRYWESAEEAAKLPADAVAVAQQLLLWSPTDDRLLWTLAEVYAAKGRVRDAHSAYRMLASDDGRKFQTPRLVGQHVNRVAAAFAKLRPELAVVPDTPDDTPAPAPPNPALVFGLIDPVGFTLAVLLFAAVLFLMLALQVRASVRRRRPRG